MSPSALGPPQALFRGLQKQLCLHVVPQMRNSHCPPSSWDFPVHCRHAAGSMQGSCGSAQKKSPRALLQVSSASQRYKNHTKARRKALQNLELLKKKGTARLLVQHLKEGTTRHSRFSIQRMPPSCPNPWVQIPTHISWMFLCRSPMGLLGFFLPRVLSHLPSGMNDSRSNPEAS